LIVVYLPSSAVPLWFTVLLFLSSAGIASRILRGDYFSASGFLIGTQPGRNFVLRLARLLDRLVDALKSARRRERTVLAVLAMYLFCGRFMASSQRAVRISIPI